MSADSVVLSEGGKHSFSPHQKKKKKILGPSHRILKILLLSQ